jgi:NDP-sugar pyrophosphorylase family protein
MSFYADIADFSELTKDRAALERPATHFLKKMSRKSAFLKFSDGETIPVTITSSSYGMDNDRISITYIEEGERRDHTRSAVANIDDLYENDPAVTGEIENHFAQECSDLAEAHAKHFELHPDDGSTPGPTAHLIAPI